MNRITAVMKMHVKEKWGWFLLPWIILFFSFSVNLVIGLLTHGNEPIYTGGMASIYIYILVMGMVALSQMFQFALGLSVRRTDFFLGSSGIFVAISAAVTIVLFLLSLLEQWTGGWGVNLHFFHIPYFNDGSAIEQLLISFVLMLNMCFLGFTISGIYQRFGRSGLLIFFGVLFVLASIGSFLCTYYGWWLDVFHWFTRHSVFELTMWTIPLVVVYILASYVMLRKATV